MPDAPMRRGYLDWMRGLAVLVMIETHLLDSWTRVADRSSWQFQWAMIAGGFGAPLFLFLAGVSVALSAGSTLRRAGDRRAAARAVIRRGWWVFALAFLFRVQAWILGWSSPKKLLKVDVLNIMGPSISGAAALWGGFHSLRARYAAFVAATLAIALLTPIVWITPLLDPLPDALEAYIRPIPGLTGFCIFPWAGFVFAGTVAGMLIDATRTREAEAQIIRWLFAGGAALALGAYAASFLPSPYARSEFWESSPAFFVLRAGFITAMVAVAYAWNGWATGWSPLQQLGRTSLFIYWIHVEMVYGLISVPLHKALPLGTSVMALVVFALFMLVCSLAKDRVVAWWRTRKPSSSGGAELVPR